MPACRGGTWCAFIAPAPPPHPPHTVRPLPQLLLPIGLVALLLPSVQGQQGYAPGSAAANYQNRREEDPRDLYFVAYGLVSEAEALAAKKSYNSALQKGQEAERILATIVRDFPNWNTKMVAAKRKLLAENMSIYRRNVKRSTIPTSRQPGVAVSMEMPQISGMENGEYHPDPLPNYATTDRKLYHNIARLQEEVRRMVEAYRELNARYTEVMKRLTAEQMEKKMYQERYEKLMDQVTAERAAGNSVVESLSRRLAESEAKCRAAEASVNEIQARAAELESRLAEAQNALMQVTRERDNLLMENEKLRAVIELNSPQKTKALLDQNLTLAEQLKAAKEKISELEAMQSGMIDENAVLARQLDETRAEAARLRDEMTSIYDENMGFRRRVSELTQKLNHLEAELQARAEQPVADPALADENKMLLGIIDKQRRTIAMQNESRRLLFETYSALKKDDPEVMAIIRKMQDEDPQALTDEEIKVLENVRDGLNKEDPAATAAAQRKLEVETLVGLANKAFSKGRYVSAEQLYLTLYDIEPDNVAGLVNLGTILLHNNKYEEAVHYLSRAARLAPQVAVCSYLAGIAYYRLEQMPEAQRMFARAVQLDPGNAEAFFYLANIEGISGTYDRALKHFAAAVKIRPQLADAHYNMARLYAETSRIPEAARSYDRAVQNGSMPDPDFENYLRHHPDNTKKPGADLVALVKPADEARLLRGTDAKPDDSPKPAEPDDDKKLASFNDEVSRIATAVPAVAEASPAGIGHELPAERFSSIRMRVRSGLHTLRVKRAEPRRLRTRGEGSIEPLKGAVGHK